MNVIKQIVGAGRYGMQTIKMIVKDNERGPQGEQGEPGTAATIAVGNVYTTPAGSNAEIMNTGSASNAVFDFYIPKGDKGAPGQAATVTVGSTDTIAPGSNALVINSGDSTNAVLNFKIPRGEKGERGYRGYQGEPGAAGRDGAIQYTAGTGINITNGNVIEATGDATAAWGGIQGNINDQTDLKNRLDRTVMADLDVNGDTSTSVLQLDASKVNLMSGATSTKNIPLPVASSTQAGVMNASTFDAITENSNAVNALLNGSVSVTGLSASPTQSELTTAWQTETGLTDLINRAQMLDTTNSLIWTYYVNSETWYSSPAGGTVTINTFTNSSEGTIKGSTNTGQIFAENDGTGSVNGWDSLSASVASNTANKLATANLTVGSTLSRTTSGSGSSTVVNLDVADNGITSGKIATGAASGSLRTTNNLAPSADTTAGWRDLFRSLYGENGYFVTWYDTENQFTNQPSRYGQLETIMISGSDILQRFHTQTGGRCFYRAGNNKGWYGGQYDPGAFREFVDNETVKNYAPVFVADGKEITSGADLNDNTWCQPGNYYCRQDSTAASLSNCPVTTAFRMQVANMCGTGRSVSPQSGTYVYLLRTLTNYNGETYNQLVANNGNSSWTYGSWARVINNGQTGTVGSGLIANNAVTAAKIDWSTLGYSYKTISTIEHITPTSSALIYPVGWDFSFSAVSGAVYEVELTTAGFGILDEGVNNTKYADLQIVVNSGATKITGVSAYARGTSGNTLTTKILVTATSTTVSLKAAVQGSANYEINLGPSLYTAKRVA